MRLLQLEVHTYIIIPISISIPNINSNYRIEKIPTAKIQYRTSLVGMCFIILIVSCTNTMTVPDNLNIIAIAAAMEVTVAS